MIELLKKFNTVFTIATTVYAVSKFMYKTFQKYEEKHGKSKTSVGGRTLRNKEEELLEDI